MINPKLVQRLATMTNEHVAKLPRIHIPTYDVLFHLMVWRNRNKDKVRNFKSVVQEGTISVFNLNNFQYFCHDDVSERVFHMNKTTEKEYIAFIYDLKTWQTYPIANTISFYPEDGAVQDMITLHATVMAYLNEIGVTEIKEGETYRIEEVKL